jgi:2',3'-cyclic-nucleotide 2'-phosphodiesterase/3'-nucleotidase
VLCHSGAGNSSSYGDALPWPENAAAQLAEQVPGIDAILVGHAHVEITERHITNAVTGKPVLLSEPLVWGMRLSVMDLDLTYTGQRWQVSRSGAFLLDAGDGVPDPRIEAVVAAEHGQVRRYVNTVIGQSTVALSAARSRVQASPVIDLINHVQAAAVADALAGTQWAGLPVLGVAAAYNPGASIPAGSVTIRDIAGLYNYDNTLVGVILTGGQLRDYLEHSARYYRQVTGTGQFEPRELCNAATPLAAAGTPDYNYDMLTGLRSRLAYDIDIARAPGSRLTRLDYDGIPVADDQRFVLALNSYRRAGGGDYPWIREAPVVYNALAETRQLIIDWVRDAGTIDPADFAHCAWRLLADGREVQLSPEQPQRR